MKTTKMSLANIQGKLSRTEMKSIMAGSGDGGTYCTDSAICQEKFGSNCYCLTQIHKCGCVS